MDTSEIANLPPKIVIFDTEYTTWEGAKERMWSGENEHRELVQIAAQKVDLERQTVIGEFSAFVRPRINHVLSAYFTELTHLTQAQIASDGEDFAAVYPRFMEWCEGLPIFSYGGSKTTDGDILKENIDLYGLNLRYDPEQHHNLRPMFESFGIDVTQYTSGQLYRAFGLELGGHVHNAMHDVESLVQSLFAARTRV